MNKKYFFMNRIGKAALVFCLLLVAASLVAEDLNLERAVQLALERNERALAAGEQWRAAQGRAAQARAYFFPAVSFSGNLTRRPNAVERQIDDQVITIQSQNALVGQRHAQLDPLQPRGHPQLPAGAVRRKRRSASPRPRPGVGSHSRWRPLF